MLPKDLWIEISLYLKPNELKIINTSFNFYNDLWYKQKLILEYPNIELWTNTNFKDLYEKSLLSGDLHWYKIIDTGLEKLEEFPIKGIKVTNIGIMDHLILTFNGELWLCVGKTLKLIDTNVIDISDFSYIKHNEWYILDRHTFETKLIKQTLGDNIFLSIASDSDDFTWGDRIYQICAITSTTLYTIDYKDEYEPNEFNLIKVYCKCTKDTLAKKIVFIGGLFCILYNNNDIIMFNLRKKHFTSNSMNVKDVMRGTIVLPNNKVILLPNNLSINKIELIFDDWDDHSITLPGSIMCSVDFYDGYYMLIDNILHVYNSVTGLTKLNYSVKSFSYYSFEFTTDLYLVI